MHRSGVTGRIFVLVAAGLWAGACEDTSYRDIGAEIGLLTKRDDALVPPSVQRLASYGRRALPQIETAMHTASPVGKLHLLAVLELTHDVEAVPIFRHFALYDPSADIRATCERVLNTWSAESDRHAEHARAALTYVREKRAQGIGPVVIGEIVPGAGQ